MRVLLKMDSCLQLPSQRKRSGTTRHTYSSTWKSEKLSVILTATSHLPPMLNCRSELMSPSCPHGPKKGVRWRPDTGPFPPQQHQSAHSNPSPPLMPAAVLAFFCLGTHSLNPNSWQMMMFFLMASTQKGVCSL